METTAAKAKGRNGNRNGGNRNNGGDPNGGDRNNGRDRNNGKDRNTGGDRNNGRDRNAKPITVNSIKGTPTMVMPALASQDVAATFRSQVLYMAFTDARIPRWESAYKTSSLRKAKTEAPEMY
jgi:hypothetical protein